MKSETTMSARDFCRLLATQYAGKPDEQAVSIGLWEYPEPDPEKMTIWTLPRFSADISITVGELRRMGDGE